MGQIIGWSGLKNGTGDAKKVLIIRLAMIMFEYYTVVGKFTLLVSGEGGGVNFQYLPLKVHRIIWVMDGDYLAEYMADRYYL